jgi:hypothetical protein
MIGMLMLLATAGISDDPLAQADDGMIQCYGPNETAKSCQSIASYRRNADGTYANTAIVLLAPSPIVTLETVTTVTIEDGAVCGFIRKTDIANGKLSISNKAVPAAQAAPLLEKVSLAMASLVDRKICTRYVPAGTGLTAKATVAGETDPIPDQAVKWVKPSDGYTVAP